AGAPGWPPGAVAVQAAASRASVITVAAARVARAAGRDVRMLVPPAQRSRSASVTPARLDDLFQRTVRPLGSRKSRGGGPAGRGPTAARARALQPVGAPGARLRWVDGIGNRSARRPGCALTRNVRPNAAWGC